MERNDLLPDRTKRGNSGVQMSFLRGNDPGQPTLQLGEAVTLKKRILTEQDKERLLILTQLTDMVVPMDTMMIDGVKQHRSLAFGHSGGFLAHLLADRNMIAEFAETRVGNGR